MNRLIAASLMLLTAWGSAIAHDHEGHDHHDHEATAPVRGSRLVVTDALANVVHVLDIDSAQVIGSFTVPGEAGGRVTVTDSGSYVLVAHRDANRVSVIHSGLTVEDHGHHAHLLQGSPYVLATMNVGRQPNRIIGSGPKMLVFNDADGTVAILDENLFGLSLNHDLIETGVPGQGFALPVADFVLVGHPDSSSLEVFDAGGSLLDSFEDCPGLQDALAVADTAVFGCSDGIVLAEPHGDHLHWTHIANPAGSPAGTRLDGFHGQRGNVAVGSFGSGLAFIDVAAVTFSVLELPAAPLAAAVSGDHAVVLDAAGSVQLVHIHGDHGHLEATLPDVVHAGTAGGQPALGLLGDLAFVTDPAAGQVLVLDVSEGTVRLSGAISVPGNPGDLGVLMPDGDFEWH